MNSQHPWNPISARNPGLGISACLLGQKVRYDGGHKRDYFVTEIFGPFVEWVPVCPELEVRMGVPREAVRLVGNGTEPRMIAERSGKDWTAEMKRFSASRAGELKRFNLYGYVLKKDSPSCGMERVKIYSPKGGATRDGRGLFAAALMNELRSCPLKKKAGSTIPSCGRTSLKESLSIGAGKRPRQGQSQSERWSISTPRINFSCLRTASATIATLDAWLRARSKHLWVKLTNDRPRANGSS